MKTQKTKKQATKRQCLGGDRVVVIRNGKGMYATQFNTCFGIVVWGTKEKAFKLFSHAAPEILNDLREKGCHVVWVEQIGECPCGCHLLYR